MNRKYPSVDIGKCTLCMGCLEVAPAVFTYNEAAGYIEVIELKIYPQKEVDEAIKICPADCIEWEEGYQL